jgi:hypothetical protein
MTPAFSPYNTAMSNHPIEELHLLRAKCSMLSEALLEQRAKTANDLIHARALMRDELSRVYLPNQLYNEICAALLPTASASQRARAYETLTIWRSQDRAP